MLLAAFLVLLPAIALCEPTVPVVKQIPLEMLKTLAGPCVLEGKCPPSFSFDHAIAGKNLQLLKAYQTPEECKGDLSADDSVRKCAFKAVSDFLNLIAESLKTPEQIQAAKTYFSTVLDSMKPCIMEGQDCDKIPGLTVAQLRSELQKLDQLRTLPAECATIDTEQEVRVCYNKFLEKAVASAQPSELILFWLLSEPFIPM